MAQGTWGDNWTEPRVQVTWTCARCMGTGYTLTPVQLAMYCTGDPITIDKDADKCPHCDGKCYTKVWMSLRDLLEHAAKKP